MKKISICIFAALIFSSVGFAQFKGNTMTLEEYYKIKINGTTMLELINSSGNYSNL